VAQAVQAYLAYVAEAVRPHASGATYVNFMDLDATIERVRAAYSPEDWERLVALKDRYDPTNLFRFNRNIPPSSAATSAVKRDKDFPVGEAGR
jgi:FAD/FMN-containing dehydrogenase